MPLKKLDSFATTGTYVKPDDLDALIEKINDLEERIQEITKRPSDTPTVEPKPRRVIRRA